MYQPESMKPEPKLRCFIPELIPAVGDIDPMLKVRFALASFSDSCRSRYLNQHLCHLRWIHNWDFDISMSLVWRSPTQRLYHLSFDP